MKTSFLISVAIAIVLVVALIILWWVLQVSGVFDAVSRQVTDITGQGATSFDLEALLSLPRVLGVSLVLAGLEIVLISALATLFAFIYNLTVGIAGGLDVTLGEDS